MLASTLKNPNEHTQDFLFVFVLFFKMTCAVGFFLCVNPLNFPVSTSKKVDWPIFRDYEENLVYKCGSLSVMMRSDCKCEVAPLCEPESNIQ